MSDSIEEPGMQTPDGPVLTAMESPRRWTPTRIALQLLGLVIGLALLAWASSLALGEDNRRSIEAMRHAQPIDVCWLMGLSIASLVLNGLMFWIVLRPVQRLRPLDVILVNSVATFLSILPFKISLMMRVLIHHRRDGVRFKLLVAWVAAMGALGLAVLLPFVGATLWRGGLDGWWWGSSIVGVVAFSALGIVLGRAADRFPILRVLSFGADQIVRHSEAVIGHGVFRLMDVAVLAGRFLAAAAIVDIALPLEQAVLLATIYFLLSVITPAGTLGFREMGVAALGLLQGLDEGAIALIALVVTGAEILTSGALALVASIRLRPDLLLLRKATP